MSGLSHIVNYQHQNIHGQKIPLPVGKIVCVGRNYLMHIKELNNVVPDKPLLFIKPTTSLVSLNQGFEIPQDQGECHNEIEVAVLIKDVLHKARETEVEDVIWGYGLALDLTLRDVQAKLKNNGQPWERAKAFDGSCPMSDFIEKSHIPDHQSIHFSLNVNGESRQVGNTRDMLISINTLLCDISQVFTLLPGDIVLTGTPQGVGPLYSKDKLELKFADFFSVSTEVE